MGWATSTPGPSASTWPLDVAYTHIFLRDARISQDLGSANTYGSIQGTYRSSIDILSAQLVDRS